MEAAKTRTVLAEKIKGLEEELAKAETDHLEQPEKIDSLFKLIYVRNVKTHHFRDVKDPIGALDGAEPFVGSSSWSENKHKKIAGLKKHKRASSSQSHHADKKRGSVMDSLRGAAHNVGHRGRTRVIQRRFNVSVPRARVPEKASTLRDRSKR